MTEPLSNQVQLGEWDFHEISLADRNRYAEYIQATEYPANLWSSNFAYLWASSQSRLRKVLWKVVDGLLVTFGHSHKNSLYLFCLPFGAAKPDQLVAVVSKCLRYCYQWNQQESGRTLVRMINESQLEFLRNSAGFEPLFRQVTLQGIERHFDIHQLDALAGKNFANIRNRINKFCRENSDVVIRRYRKSDYDGLIALGTAWKRDAGKKYDQIFDGVYYRQIIEKCDELDQIVLVFQKGKQIVGMVSGGELPTGQAWGSLLKYEAGMPGISEALTVEFARELVKLNPNIELMNVGSDLGPGGLRDYKLKFRPVLNLKRYQLYPKQR